MGHLGMVWWFVGGMAWASARVDVEIVPDPAPPRATRRAPPARPVVPVAWGHVRIDGRLDDAVWSRARQAPPLEPLADGLTPRAAQAWIARGRRGLDVAVRVPGESASMWWVVDPDGLRQRWWRVRLGPDGVQSEHCTLGVPTADPREWVPTRAARCRDAGPVHHATDGEGTWEFHVPWEAMPQASSSMRVGWVVDGPSGGTWAPFGRSDARPEDGLFLKGARPPVRLTGSVDPETGTWNGRVTASGPLDETAWRWRRMAQGVLLDEGVLELAGEGPWTWTAPRVEALEFAVEVRAVSGRPAQAAHVWRRGASAEAWLVTPVHDGRVELAWSTPAPVVAAWTVRGPRGQTVTWRDLDVPGGRGVARFTLPKRWSTVQLTGSWLQQPVVAVRKPRP